ncbi:hypothetical protein BaRGS_00026984 [Batillaria attramentaria]|uniref:P/Homo B domain-containing protein n=1 Tax=Batillaria attramentaria TaxID=370345 RepID=A0ABD0K3Z2_9CAEN
MDRSHLNFLRVAFFAVLFLTCTMYVDGAPAFGTYQSKKEPRCSHNADETLCWTVQFRRPLHVMTESVRQMPRSISSSSSALYFLFKASSALSAEVMDVQGTYQKMASLLAQDTGLSLLGRVGEFIDHFVFCHGGRAKEAEGSRVFQDYHRAHSHLLQKDRQTFAELKAQIEAGLEQHSDVAWFSMETVHQRQKRAVTFNDPAFNHQWHLVNHQEFGMDINVTGVWESGITGKGVTVAVVDDGLEWDNPDLHSNYNVEGSWDLNDNDPDPMPNAAKVSNHHGTRCAGEIAAVANNGVCGVGVAYGAKVSGIRLLDGPMTDSLEAEAFNKKLDINAIYSCSWGPDDDGKTVDGPHLLAAKAMKYGVDYGRHGYGSIFVVASGNGGSQQDNCNYDGYANSIYTVTIGAVDESGAMPYYAEECASMLGVTFSSGIASKRDIVTTDWRHKGGTGCTDKHTGTSAAAPLAAGMIGLMLAARPCLTWRDVQYIIIMTAVKVDVDLAHWQINGAGLEHSHKHGFGLIKAWRMVNAARVWRPVSWMSSYSQEDTTGWNIPRGTNIQLVVNHTVTSQDIAGYSLYMLEYVQVTLTLTHPVRGKLAIHLQCPSGTVSVIGAPRPNDNSTEGFSDWTFTTVRCWGEEPTGKWTLFVKDLVTADSTLHVGRLVKWRLTLFGTSMTASEFQDRRREVEAAMSGQYLSANYTPPCDPPPVTTPPFIPLSEKTLKILFLASAFCVVFAIYETFEYMLCYGEEKRQQQAEMSSQAQRSASSSYGVGEDTPETARLLSRQESGTSGDTHQDTEFHDILQRDGEDEEDDMFLLDDGIVAGHRQPKNGSQAGAARNLPGEGIPMSLFSSSVASTQNGGNFTAGEGSAQHSHVERSQNGASLPNRASAVRSSGLPNTYPLTNNITGETGKRNTSQASPTKESILPDMWRALTQEGSDSDEADDEVFSQNRASSKSPLLQNGASSANR